MKYSAFLFASSFLCCFLSTPKRLAGATQEGNSSCFSGYIMDTYCILRGTLLDNPTLATLQNPHEHSLHCLIDPSECIENGYEILGPPNGGSNYIRVAKFDDGGNEMIVTLAKQIGSGCNGCQGTQTKGFQATVVGMIGSEGEPPVMTLIKVFPFSVSCDDAQTAAANQSTGNNPNNNNSTGDDTDTQEPTENSSTVSLYWGEISSTLLLLASVFGFGF